MKNLFNLSLVLIGLLLYSCSPKIKSNLVNSNYPPLDHNVKITILGKNETIPDNSEFIGDLKIGDAGFTTNCGYDVVIANAKLAAKRNGANFIVITQIKEPDFASTCYRLKAKMYRNFDIGTLSDFIRMRELRNKSRLPSDSDYAVIYFYRPSSFVGSAIGYKIRLDDETMIGKVRNGEKFEFKTKDFGKHVFWGKTETQESVVIDIKKGQEYFVRCGIKMGAAVGRPEMNLVENYMGISEYDEMK